MIVDETVTADLVALLKRCRTVLANMAEEREGFWNDITGRRWLVSHEPLRTDAKNIVPLIDDLLEAVGV